MRISPPSLVSVAPTLLLVFGLLAVGSGGKQITTSEPKQGEYFQRPGVKVSEIVKARGYSAQELEMVSDDGYVLGLTRATNPLFSFRQTRALRREPLLFIHGSLVDGNTFVMNSFDVKGPRDFTDVHVDKLSQEELVEQFHDEPSAKSLAFFALNFAHEVWFLHRRGTPLSQRRLKVARKPQTVMEKYLAALDRFHGRGQQRKRRRRSLPSHEELEMALNGTRRRNDKVEEAVGAAPAALLDYGNLAHDLKITLDRRLWNHSFDEQAAYDIPRAVDFVLKKTGFKRLALVGDSSGGQLILQTLILNPQLGNKLTKAICWVPSFNIGHKQITHNFALAQPLFDYVGPFPFTFASHPIQAFMEVACSLEILQLTLCTLAADLNWGNSFGQAVPRPEFGADYMTPVSAHEYLQLIQSMTYKASRMFDFRDKKKNLLAYGQEVPPVYNASMIDFEHVSIYWADSDSLVNQEDIEATHRDFRVPHRIIRLEAIGANHGSVMFHKEVARVVIIPTYKDIISHGHRRSRGNPSQRHDASPI